MATTDINLDGPQTLVLQPQTVAVIIQLLGDAPYKISRPIIDEILIQLKKPPVNSNGVAAGAVNN